MPLRPIDLQTVIPKVSSVHKSKQTVVNQQNNALTNVQMEQEKERRVESETVQKMQVTDKLTIKRQSEPKDQDSKDKKRKKRDDQTEPEPAEQQHIDIKL